MSDPADYPAAHSMDTDWFAVDAYGRVGIFDSGEAGAMPSQYKFGQTGAFEFVEAVLKQRGTSPNPCVQAWMEKTSPILLRGEPITWKDAPSHPNRAVVRSNASFSHWGSIKLAEGYFTTLRRCPKSHLRERFEKGEVTHVWFDFDLPTLLGFFMFIHGDSWENWISGPYEGLARPTLPLLVNQLPPEMRLHAPVEFAANDFMTDDSIQPIDTLPCASHQREYVATDKKTIRPIPPRKELGFDKELRESLLANGYILEEPPDPEYWKTYSEKQK